MDDLDQAREALARTMAITPAQTIAVLNHLGIADLLIDGPRAADDLAARTGVHLDALYRLLRFAASYGVFTEVTARRFGLNDQAYWLRSDVARSMHWRVETDTLVKPWLPWEEWLATVTTGEPAYDRMHGRSFWDALAADEHARATFDASLRSIAERQILATVQQLDLDGCQVLVDVGAGDGSWLASILNDRPGIHGVAFDLPQAIPALTARLAEAGLEARSEVVAGDFLADVPGGDVLLLANVLHDWDDERAATILRRCRRAVDPAGRLIVIDRVLPEGDTPHYGKAVDINMLFLLGGRERTRVEFSELLAVTGFELQEVANEDSEVAVLTAQPRDEP